MRPEVNFRFKAPVAAAGTMKKPPHIPEKLATRTTASIKIDFQPSDPQIRMPVKLRDRLFVMCTFPLSTLNFIYSAVLVKIISEFMMNGFHINSLRVGN
jgi:hypothetical protein